jgi:hypothetical protein
MRAGCRLKIGVEKRVHQSAFTETSFGNTQNIEDKSILYALVDQLIGQAIESDMAREFHITQMIFKLKRRM